MIEAGDDPARREPDVDDAGAGRGEHDERADPFDGKARRQLVVAVPRRPRLGDVGLTAQAPPLAEEAVLHDDRASVGGEVLGGLDGEEVARRALRVDPQPRRARRQRERRGELHSIGELARRRSPAQPQVRVEHEGTGSGPAGAGGRTSGAWCASRRGEPATSAGADGRDDGRAAHRSVGRIGFPRSSTIAAAMRSPAWPSHSAGQRGSDLTVEGAPGSPHDGVGCAPDELVRALGDGDRSLRVVAQGEARDAQRRRLLLDAAGVGEHEAGAGHQAEEVEVAERFGDQDAVGDGAPGELGSGARMGREDERQLGADRVQGVEQLAEHRPGRRRWPGGAGSRRRTARRRHRGAWRSRWRGHDRGCRPACRSSRCRPGGSGRRGSPRRAGCRPRRRTGTAAGR